MQPIMELKANERLSILGFAQIKRFFAKLSSLWQVSSAVGKIKIGKCLRCIVKGGKDPTVLRSLHREWAPDGFRLRITDTSFLIKCLRESGALEVVVQEFLNVSDTLHYNAATLSAPSSEVRRSSELGVLPDSPDQRPVYENEYDDPEFYGVPRSFLNRGKAEPSSPTAGEVEEKTPEEPSVEAAAPAESAREGEEAGEGQATEGEAAPDGTEENTTSVTDAPVERTEEEAVDEEKSDPEPPLELVEGGEAQEAAEVAEAPAEEQPQPEETSSPLAVDTTPFETTFELSPAPFSRSPKMSLDPPDENPSVQRDLSHMLLDLCLDLSVDGECAALMCQRSICDGAITMLEKDFNFNPRDPRLARAVELMWNVLEPFIEQFKVHNASPDEVRQCLSNYSDQVVDFGHAVDVLQSIIVYGMHEGFRQADKELRNEVLIILTMLAQFPCAVSYFLQSGLFHLLLTYACIEEAGSESWEGFCQDIGKFRNFATIADIDLEFKKELWFILSELLRSNDPDALEVFSSSPLQATLLQYMEHDSFDTHKKPEHAAAAPETFNFSVSLNASRDDTMLSKSVLEDKKDTKKPHRLTAQMVSASMGASAMQSRATTKKVFISQLPLSKLREFQLLAVAFLLHNAPRVLPAFESLGGPERAIALTLQYCQSDVPEHKTFIFYCLMLLQRCLMQSLALRAFMEQNNLIQSFLYVYHKSEHEETQAQALRLISTLCTEDNRPLQQLFDNLGGIADLVNLLANYVRKRPPLAGTKAGVKLTIKGEAAIPDPYENPYGGEISVLVISVLDCLMKAVVGNEDSELNFAELEGVDVLLELVETSPFVLRLKVLRFLSDILMHHKLAVYVNAWRSPKTLRSAAQILCHCWMDEEARVVGEKRKDGIISDLSHPLGHQEPNSPTPTNPEVDVGSPRDSVASSSIGNYFAEVANNATTSITVSKLATAILAGRNATQTNLPIDICTQALDRDSRVLIANILDSLGVFELYGIQQGGRVAPGKDEVDAHASSMIFDASQSFAFDQSPSMSPGSPKQVNFDGTEQLRTHSSESKAIGAAMATLSPVNNILGLTSADQQVLSMAKLYGALREAEWWQAVQKSAEEAEVIPIEADLALIEARLQFSCEAAAAVRTEQIALYNEEHRVKMEGEVLFIDNIITKKNQQIKAEWLKKNGTKLVVRGPTKVGKKSTQN